MSDPQTQGAVSADLFRQLLARFASGITVLTTVDARQRAHGMTVSAFTSLSLNPPLVLVCVDRAASMLTVLDAASHFAVNILAQGQDALSRRFSREEMVRRFDGIGYSLGAGGVPVLHDALAVAECRRTARYDAGDHAIFIGEVVAGTMSQGTRPLIYFAGSYERLER